jgi:hypothetical protein
MMGFLITIKIDGLVGDESIHVILHVSSLDDVANHP